MIKGFYVWKTERNSDRGPVLYLPRSVRRSGWETFGAFRVLRMTMGEGHSFSLFVCLAYGRDPTFNFRVYDWS